MKADVSLAGDVEGLVGRAVGEFGGLDMCVCLSFLLFFSFYDDGDRWM